MSLYIELPVYKKSYDLLLELHRLSMILPKSYRYTYGERLQKESFELLVNIYKSNATVEKIPVISKGRENLEVIRLAIRILFDMKQIGIKKMVLVNEMIEDVSKQLAGWQKSCQGK